MTGPEILLQYEARMGALQSGIQQARFHSAVAAVGLAIFFALFLAAGLLATRHQVSFLWPSVPVPLAAASAFFYRRSQQSQAGMHRLLRFYSQAVRACRETGWEMVRGAKNSSIRLTFMPRI